MKFKIKSIVYMSGFEMEYEHIQLFDENSNVFGRVLEYHQYMYKKFPGLEFKLVKAIEV